MDEVVVSGVASATPTKNLTISVEKVDAEQLKAAHSSSAASALQGKVAGLSVVKANGLPGGGASLRLRGSTSLVGNQKPMIILDGTIINTNLADINLDDIETFEVVKGAAAAALYGSEAGNGVIVINTKRGKGNEIGKSTIIVRSEMGYQKLINPIELSTHHPYQLADNWEEYDDYTKYDGIFYYQGAPISGNRIVTEAGYADQPYSNLYNNQDLFFKKGIYHTEYIGITGKTTTTNFLISFENNNQGGILFNTKGYQRNNLKFNLDHRISDKLKISTSNLLFQGLSRNPGSTGTFSDLLFISPDVDLTRMNADSTPYEILPDPWGIAENPLYPLYYRKREAKRLSVIGNVRLNYDLTDWLNFDTKYTYEYRNKLWKTVTPKGYKVNNGQYAGGSLYRETYNELEQNLQFTTNINKQFGDWTTKVKLSYLYEKSFYEDFSVTGRDFVFAGIDQLNNTNPERSKLNSYEGNIVSINYFGIIDGDYKDKYLLSALYRMDGSSLFGAEERWNPYFRVSGGYRITEDFQIKGIQEMKIRASYGTSGQRPGFSSQYETWNLVNGVASRSSSGNKHLKPSTTKELEVSFEMNFLSKFSFNTSYSQSRTENAFAKAPLPSHYGGYDYQWSNVGTLSAKALEASLGIKVLNTSALTWNTNFIFDRVRQKIESLNIPEYKTGPKNAFYVKAGETFGIIYGNKWLTSLDDMSKQLPAGASISDYEVNNEGYVIPAGTQGTRNEIPIAQDANNDGLADKIQIGDGNSKFNLSMSNSISYKGLNLYFLLSWKNGGDVYNYTHQYTFRDLRAVEFDQFGKPDDQKKTIDYYSTFYKNTEINSYFIEDGSYLKLRELSLSYELKKEQLGLFLGKNIQSIRLGFEARNVLTITNYKGYDPEVASGSDLSNYPFDNFGYPNFRTYTGSIKFTF